MTVSTEQPRLTDRFQQAFGLASEVHAGQVRKGTTIPYLAHLMSVAALVLEHGGDEDTAIAALLHDAVEDGDDGAAIERQIRDQFGDRVIGLVLGCSDSVAVPGLARPPWLERRERYLARLAQETDPDVLLVSACDKLHNTRAILADLRAIGPVVWDRFTVSDPDRQVWYYSSLVESYRGRIDPNLWGELDRTIREITDLAARGYHHDDPAKSDRKGAHSCAS